MSFRVINNPRFNVQTGFTNAQFKKLDDLYCRAAAAKALSYRTVECDFDEGVAVYTYFRVQGHAAFLQFIIRKVGPKTLMYEVFKEGKGRIAKSGVFDRAFEKLRDEITPLFDT